MTAIHSSGCLRPELRTMPSVPYEGDRDFSRHVDEMLTGFLERKSSEMPSVAGELVREIAVLLGGGKRLRPLLCHLGWLGAGGERDDRAALQAASALELFHIAALIHDDIMDRSDLRHGVASVHRRLARYWDDPAQPERSEWFGVCSGIVAGDLCWAWSEEMFRTCCLPDAALNRAGAYLATMRTEVMAGQYLDLHPPVGFVSDWLGYAEQVNLYKTARYTVARPLQIGAALAGAPAALLSAFQQFGERLGLAFQLRDDLLGVFGDPSRTGKSNEDDLREGKRTMLVATALQYADSRQAATIESYLGNAHGRTELDCLRAAIAATGAPDRIQEAITETSRAAIEALHGAPLNELLRDTLIQLAVSLTDRAA
ncbi:polyprenyl synthetase family protein [Nocardia yunnanensis]|uniref:Polyprenyl synthetase family protein n=1 Tax=Nocardia yunnanensis TaxID=2382165 RepID=A0A386ZMM0_9NOCA|nr:polyprenyl synthetase family protein [Nocardia yunnanensis]AYF77939.1 polyprenyl synthetase family protein [Nocardia yunnanensis]